MIFGKPFVGKPIGSCQCISEITVVETGIFIQGIGIAYFYKPEMVDQDHTVIGFRFYIDSIPFHFNEQVGEGRIGSREIKGKILPFGIADGITVYK